MAQLQLEGDELVLSLTRLEASEALHGTLKVPRTAIRQVEAVDDARHALRGWLRGPGTGAPGWVSIGTYHRDGHKAFAVIHHDTPKGVRILLNGANFDELIVGCSDPDAVIGRLEQSN